MTGPSSTRTGTLVRIAAAVAIALGFVACRPGEGDLCRCPGECKNGLVCAQSGAVIDSCVDPGPGEPPGRCIEQDGLADMADDGGETLLGNYHDVGGKRDFAPDSASDPSGDTTVAPTTDASETTAPTSSGDATTSTTDASTSSGGTGTATGTTTGTDATTSSGSTTSGG
jgi:hypothetical protein